MPGSSERVFALGLILLVAWIGFAGTAEAIESTITDGDLTADDSAPVAVPEATDKALRYYRSGVWLWWFSTLWGFLVPAAILFSGLSARLRDLAKSLGQRWFFIVAIYLVLYAILMFVVELPLAYYLGYVRPHAYGLSNQTFDKWIGDAAKGLMVSLIPIVLFGWIPFLLIRKSPRRWWLYLGLTAIPFMFLAILVTPIWVSPLFNDFGPMKDPTLEAQILELAERAGIEDSRVFEVDKSVDTEAVNAYVTGFMETKRIVLWDTIIEKLERDELLFVMSHEMGHYVLNHIVIAIVFYSLTIMLALFAIHRAAGLLISRYRPRFRFEALSDVASLPLILLLFSAIFFVLSPMTMAFSRYHEHEADRFGLELTRKNRPAAMAFVRLQQENLGNPRPGFLFKLWRASHPPLGERIDFCNSYRPWVSGEPLRYSDRLDD